MKRFLLMGLIGLCLPTGVVRADPNGAVLGVVAGTAAGLIIANNVHGVNPWVAAPVGALLGGYIGAQYDRRGQYYRDEEWRYRRHDQPYYRHGYDDPHYRYDYDRGYYRDDYYPPLPPTVVYVEKQQVEKPSPIQQTTDVHPGVDLIKVSILNSNGIRTDIPVLRVKGKFVGPQGESYESLPTAEQLAKRYGM